MGARFLKTHLFCRFLSNCDIESLDRGTDRSTFFYTSIAADFSLVVRESQKAISIYLQSRPSFVLRRRWSCKKKIFLALHFDTSSNKQEFFSDSSCSSD